MPIIPIALACGGDDGGSSGIKIPDAAVMADAPVVCTATGGSGYGPGMFGSAGSNVGAAYKYNQGVCQYNPDGDYYSWAGRLESGSPFDAMFVDLWAGFGAFGSGTVGSGTYQITGDDTKFSTCGLCVMVLTDIVVSNGMISSYADWYFATSGTVVINAPLVVAPGGTVPPTGSGNYKVTIQSASLTHVGKTANGNPADTAADNCTSTITNLAINSRLLAGSAGDCAVDTGNGESARLVGVTEDGMPIFLRNRHR